jgi:hypothetical protein
MRLWRTSLNNKGGQADTGPWAVYRGKVKWAGGGTEAQITLKDRDKEKKQVKRDTRSVVQKDRIRNGNVDSRNVTQKK